MESKVENSAPSGMAALDWVSNSVGHRRDIQATRHCAFLVGVLGDLPSLETTYPSVLVCERRVSRVAVALCRHSMSAPRQSANAPT